MNHPAASPEHPAQGEMPFAVVGGTPLMRLPMDLYIPPDALEVFLEAFEGPLDLLLYLIRRQNIDILDIPISEITDQYIRYIEMMQDLRFELAAEYLLMAAILAEIKSRMLLPRPRHEDDPEADPRAELVRRLQEYERYRAAALNLDQLPRLERDIHPAVAYVADRSVVTVPPDLELQELLLALSRVLHRSALFQRHAVARDPLSVRERMARVIEKLRGSEYLQFEKLFAPEEGRAGVVVSFLAILELLKEHLIEVVQNEPTGPIHIRARM